MKRDILFSVIIPIYNSEKYISKTIDSVLSQDYTRFELILIDDGSSDNSYNIINEYLKIDDRITYVKKTNSGASETRNYGLKYAKGSYIFFLDSDDLIAKNTLSTVAKNLYKKEFDIIVFGFDNFDDNNHVTNTCYPALPKNEYFKDEIKKELIPRMIVNFKDEIDCNVHFNRMMIIKKSLIDNCNWKFLSERIFLSEDVVSLIELFYNCKSVKIINSILYHYRVNPNSLTHQYDETINIKCNNMLKKLLERNSCSYDNLYTERVIYLYFSYIIVNIKLLVHSSLPILEKIDALNTINNDVELIELIKKYNYLNSFKRKLFFYLIKYNRKVLILLLSLVNKGKL